MRYADPFFHSALLRCQLIVLETPTLLVLVSKSGATSCDPAGCALSLQGKNRQRDQPQVEQKPES
jgi:hypothetical protein